VWERELVVLLTTLSGRRRRRRLSAIVLTQNNVVRASLISLNGTPTLSFSCRTHSAKPLRRHSILAAVYTVVFSSPPLIPLI